MMLPSTSNKMVQGLQEHVQELLAATMGLPPVQCTWPRSLHAEYNASSRNPGREAPQHDGCSADPSWRCSTCTVSHKQQLSASRCNTDSLPIPSPLIAPTVALQNLQKHAQEAHMDVHLAVLGVHRLQGAQQHGFHCILVSLDSASVPALPGQHGGPPVLLSGSRTQVSGESLQGRLSVLGSAGVPVVPGQHRRVVSLAVSLSYTC